MAGLYVLCFFYTKNADHGDSSDRNSATRYILNKSSSFHVYHFDFTFSPVQLHDFMLQTFQNIQCCTIQTENILLNVVR